MPFCPIGQVFWPECNVIIFAPKLVDGKFSGLREKWKFLLKEKKNSCKICMKVPLVSTGQKIRTECNVSFFAQKLVDSI